MTVYLWHLPMIMTLIGIQLVLPLPLPEPGSPLWWWTRLPFLLIVLGAVWLLSLWLVRFEQVPSIGTLRFSATWATALAVVAFVVPILAITAYGLDFPLAAVALACTASALWLTGSVTMRSSAS